MLFYLTINTEKVRIFIAVHRYVVVTSISQLRVVLVSRAITNRRDGHVSTLSCAMMTTLMHNDEFNLTNMIKHFVM